MEDSEARAPGSEELGAWALGREHAQLRTPYNGEDRTFASIRVDGSKISHADYKHCTFASVSFKESKVDDGAFVDCVFIGCYFRRADLRGCSFVGCRFIDCRFSHVSIRSCDFRYSSFRGCALPSREVLYSLPPEPNLREELARNLSIESARLGLSEEARRYRDIEIRAKEAHLWAAVLGESSWYREHFDSLARTKSFFVFVASRLNRWMWGYGERPLVLLRNWILTSVLVFPLLFFAFQSEFEATGKGVTLQSLLVFSVKNAIPAGINSDVVPIGPIATTLSVLEAIYSAVTVALLASYVFRWSLHR